MHKMGVEDENGKYFAAAFDSSGKRAANRNDEVTRLRGLKFHNIHKLPVVVQTQSLAEPKERAHAIVNVVWLNAFFLADAAAFVVALRARTLLGELQAARPSVRLSEPKGVRFYFFHTKIRGTSFFCDM